MPHGSTMDPRWMVVPRRSSIVGPSIPYFAFFNEMGQCNSTFPICSSYNGHGQRLLVRGHLSQDFYTRFFLEHCTLVLFFFREQMFNHVSRGNQPGAIQRFPL